MHPAQLMISGCPTPMGATLIGYIDRHPSDKSGLGYAVLFYAASSVEVAWDGQRTRSLPNNWRRKVAFSPITAAEALGRQGGMAKSPAKSIAVKANGALGGRPKKRLVRDRNGQAWDVSTPDPEPID